MKTKLLTLLCMGSVLGATSPALAMDDYGPAATITDAVIVRPLCLAATVVGSVFWVVALPFSAPSKSIKKTAHILVEKPAYATFRRPLGDMTALKD